MTPANFDVRFTPESGHSPTRRQQFSFDTYFFPPASGKGCRGEHEIAEFGPHRRIAPIGENDRNNSDRHKMDLLRARGIMALRSPPFHSQISDQIGTRPMRTQSANDRPFTGELPGEPALRRAVS